MYKQQLMLHLRKKLAQFEETLGRFHLRENTGEIPQFRL